jgi:hypothetical protein
MKQLSGLDVTFLHIDGPSQFGQVSGLPQGTFQGPASPTADRFRRVPAAVFARAMRLSARFRLGERLNITVQSYRDVLDFGVVGCRELVPDLPVLLDAIVDDIDSLAAATAS